MRRLKFVIPMLLLAGACTAPTGVEPAAGAGGVAPSSTTSADSTPTDFPADTVSRDGGIMMGSGG